MKKVIEKAMLKAVMIHTMRDPESHTNFAVQEGVALMKTFETEAIEVLKFEVKEINNSTYIGRGQIDKVISALENKSIDFIFWNGVLSARNHRELSKVLPIPICDRTKIILEIFRMRARSSEEKIQVEIASKQHERSNRIGAWTHLERQRGSTATVGGPGEKQLELDKRMIDEQIKIYKKKLHKIKISRAQQRKNRINLPIVSIVGYTNVGKTTLFNILTKSDDLAEDKLFATLSAHTKRFVDNEKILIADTVGFIRHFPPLMENAFAATLEEMKYSSLILHIRDVNMPFEERYADIVTKTINRIGCGDIEKITVWSKWDEAKSAKPDYGICISSKTGFGISELKLSIVNTVQNHSDKLSFSIANHTEDHSDQV